MNIDIFLNQILLKSLDYLFYFIQRLQDLKLKDVTYQKELLIIIT